MKILRLAGILLIIALAGGCASGEPGASKTGSAPAPPQLPENFNWSGRYIVPDLGVNVPFTWQGHDGYSEMTAGSQNDPIYFTNLIYHGRLYTLTYKWPVPIVGDLGKCNNVAPYTLSDYNAWLKTSRYVGSAILGGRSGPAVNQFRASIVFDLQKGLVPPGNVLPPVAGTPNMVAPAGGTTPNAAAVPGLPSIPARIPVLIADFSVDQSDSHKFRQVLHFGLQNLYDPNLDEWIVMQKFSDKPGNVVLPDTCNNATPSPPLSVPSH
jgi:hypothetical protein